VTFVATVTLPLILLSNLMLMPLAGMGEQVSFGTPVTSFNFSLASRSLSQSWKENVQNVFVQLPEQQVMLPVFWAFCEWCM
jgi:hypothetical protein